MDTNELNRKEEARRIRIYRQTANDTEAASKAGLHRVTWYNWRKSRKLKSKAGRGRPLTSKGKRRG